MSEDDRTLFVGGLSDRVTQELLYELFLQAGPLEKVVVPTDKDGRPRRFAFVTFQHDVSVSYSKQVMEGIQLFGRTLSLQNRGNNSNDSPRSSPRSSPHYNSDAQQNLRPPNYSRANTWHGQASNNQGQSPKFENPRLGLSPQYEIPNPYAAGKGFMSVDVLRGQSSASNLSHQSMLPQEHAPLDVHRQRLLEQQQVSILMHGQRSDNRNNGRDKHGHHDSRGRNNYQPYNDRDRRRRY